MDANNHILDPVKHCNKNSIHEADGKAWFEEQQNRKIYSEFQNSSTGIQPLPTVYYFTGGSQSVRAISALIKTD